MKNKELALITGASGSIGNAIALTLADMGYDLLLQYYRHPEGVAALKETLGFHGTNVEIASVDLTDETSLNGMFDGIIAKKQRLAVLVNNAGCLGETPLILSEKHQLEQLIQINQVAAFECIKKAGRIMTRFNTGSIVNMGSLSQDAPLSGQAAYAMSKAALTGLTRAAALELGRFGIRVNAVIPGITSGGMIPAKWQQEEEKLKKYIPLRQIPLPKDIAACVAFLCSDKARCITGQSLAVDGGLNLTSSFTYLDFK